MRTPGRPAFMTQPTQRPCQKMGAPWLPSRLTSCSSSIISTPISERTNAASSSLRLRISFALRSFRDARFICSAIANESCGSGVPVLAGAGRDGSAPPSSFITLEGGCCAAGCAAAGCACFAPPASGASAVETKTRRSLSSWRLLVAAQSCVTRQSAVSSSSSSPRVSSSNAPSACGG